jgi:biopolymer transport protein ExbD
MEFGSPKKNKVEISLIPLVNVIFLLLIFFMVAGSVEGVDIFEVDLPHSEEGKGKFYIPTVVYLSEDGKMAVNNQIVNIQSLKTVLSASILQNENQQVTIKSDLNVPAANLIYIMNIIENAGAKDITLVTQVIEK